MEPISAYLHFVKCRDEHDIGKAPVVNQDPLNVEIGDSSRDEQCIVMGETQASQILIGESYRLVSPDHRCGEVENPFFSPSTCLSGIRDELEYPPDANPP